MKKVCQIWGTVLLSITLLAFLGYVRLHRAICDSSENPCSRECIMEKEKCDQQCQRGNYNCSLECKGKDCKQDCDAERCNLECSSRVCDQKCKGEVKGCIMYSNRSKCRQRCDVMIVSAPNNDTLEQKCHGGVEKCDARCYGGRGNCKQKCGAKNCNLECSGKECDQKCNDGVKECSMHCNAGKCKQTCEADECYITGTAIHDIAEQKCKGKVDLCDARCYVSSDRCLQHCGATKCYLKCCGKECDQKCNGCNMHCSTNECKQECDAHTCNITNIQSVNSVSEQRYNSNFNYETLYTSNAILLVSATTIEVIKTQLSATEGKVNY